MKTGTESERVDKRGLVREWISVKGKCCVVFVCIMSIKSVCVVFKYIFCFNIKRLRRLYFYFKKSGTQSPKKVHIQVWSPKNTCIFVFKCLLVFMCI